MLKNKLKLEHIGQSDIETDDDLFRGMKGKSSAESTQVQVALSQFNATGGAKSSTGAAEPKKQAKKAFMPPNMILASEGETSEDNRASKASQYSHTRGSMFGRKSKLEDTSIF